MIIRRIPKTYFQMKFGVLDRPRKGSCILDVYDHKDYVSYICIDITNVVGTLVVERSRSGRTISSVGTIVKPTYMKQGIAKKLWECMLLEESPDFVKVKLISDRGHTLIDSIKSDKRFKDIKWYISNACSRDLRVLKQ